MSINISVEAIKELRSRTGAGLFFCKPAYEQAGGDIDKAVAILEAEGQVAAERRTDRTTTEGLIYSYIHGGRIGVLVEVNCETDFVAKTDDFKQFVQDVAMQVAVTNPSSVEELLNQPFVKDESKTVQALLTEAIAKLKENVRVRRFIRFGLAEGPHKDRTDFREEVMIQAGMAERTIWKD